MELAALLQDPKSLGTGGLILVVLWRIYKHIHRQDVSDKAQDSFRDDLMARCREKEDQIERMLKRHAEALNAMGVRLDEARREKDKYVAELAGIRSRYEQLRSAVVTCDDPKACSLKDLMALEKG